MKPFPDQVSIWRDHTQPALARQTRSDVTATQTLGEGPSASVGQIDRRDPNGWRADQGVVLMGGDGKRNRFLRELGQFKCRGPYLRLILERWRYALVVLRTCHLED